MKTDLAAVRRTSTDTTLDDDDRLGTIQQYCGDNLNANMNDPILTTDLAKIANQRTTLLTNLQKINVPTAQKKAAADLSLSRKTLRTLFTDINIVSVAPVAVLDIVRIGPAQPQSGGTRIGPGAAFALSSSVPSTSLSVTPRTSSASPVRTTAPFSSPCASAMSSASCD
jgi:hypothetical protein